MKDDYASKFFRRRLFGAILDSLSSILNLVYYIGGSAALTWAGTHSAGTGDRIVLKLALPGKEHGKE